MYDPLHYRSMNKSCEHCGLYYEIEPGFFWGAMYVGYAINVAVGVTTGILTYFLFHDPATWVYFLTIFSMIAIVIPINFRFGRTIMLYLFGSVSYDKDADYSKIKSDIDPKLN